jgi:protein-disulfide isomerase
MKSRFSFILIVLVIVFGAVLLISKKDASAPENGNGGSNAQATEHTRGDNKKGVTLTEYGDFQCPACGAYYPVVEQVYDKYKGDIQFQFVNFPLTQLHPNAMLAHRTAQAASNQGKFWEMYKLLYEGQSTWSSSSSAQADSTFHGYAQSLGLDMAKFDSDQKSQETNNIINADVSKGKGLGITGTPSFFVDGKKIDNPSDVNAFSKVIEDAIKAKQ